PEVPLLGVLPGTGGLTRITDKRKVRRDLADVFCTTAEGVRADRAKQWKLVDHVAKPQEFAEVVRARALALAEKSDRPGGGGGELTELGPNRIIETNVGKQSRTATITIKGPESVKLERSADWYPLRLARELDRALLDLRHNHLDIGLWLLKTKGESARVLELDALLQQERKDWFVRETLGYLRRTLSRLDVSSRSIFALIEPGSCFAGTLMELALAADRSYMLDAENGAKVALSALNFGAYPMANGLSRLHTRFGGEAPTMPMNGAIGAGQTASPGPRTPAPGGIGREEEER